MRTLAQSVTIYIPASRTVNLKAITELCGGSTVQDVTGSWVNSTGVIEREAVRKATWWFGGHQTKAVTYEVESIVAALIVAGEEAVMVEWVSPHGGVHAELWNQSDVEVTA